MGIRKDRVGKSSWNRIRNHSIDMTNISELNGHGIRKKKACPRMTPSCPE
jgi:hypothetical protein